MYTRDSGLKFDCRKIFGTSVLIAASLAGCGGGHSEGLIEGAPTIQIMSSDIRFVTGGDALVSIVAPAGTTAKGLKFEVNGADATASLQYDEKTNSMRGLITDLRVGQNELKASLVGGRSTSLTATNYPSSGPVFSGPHLKPWTCTNLAVGLGEPLDENCSAPARYDYYYMSKETGTFKAYDLASPPMASDVTDTVTDQNVTVRYIVRQESGMVDRAHYKIAVLFDPNLGWTPFAPQNGWNHKLYVPLAGGFGRRYDSGNVTAANEQDAVLNDMALKRGFAVAKTVFLEAATHQDPVRAAESLMMLKERIVEQYGHIRFTFSSGPSGGSFTQNVVANSYPGLIQGLIPMANFIDYWSATDQQVHDCTTIESYYSRFPNLWADAAQRLAVEGNLTAATCAIFGTYFPATLVADGTAVTGVAPGVAYNANSNPGGVRQTYQDYHVNYLGRRAPEFWSAAEKAAGFGFARSPRDNVGVQYGLRALAEGKISPEQFVHLNENVGGLDIDLKITSSRTVQDAGIASAMYRTSAINDGQFLNTVPIIAVRLPDPDPIASHEIINSFIQQERLIKTHGNADNYVLWIIPGYDAAKQHELSFGAMDEWLTAIEKDSGDQPLSTKVTKNKPASLKSGCWNPADASDVRLTNQVTNLNVCTSNWYKVSDTPRTVASMGNHAATFITKCQLKPLSKDAYNVTFSDAQWSRLVEAFPNGVCDWTKEDKGLTTSVPWLDYTSGPGGVALAQPSDLPRF